MIEKHEIKYLDNGHIVNYLYDNLYIHFLYVKINSCGGPSP